MTDRNDHRERIFDQITDEIRSARLDEATERAVTDRVWRHVTAEVEGAHVPLRGCDDVRVLIPRLVDGSLPEARALLVEDHVRDCIGCRRSLMEARGLAAAPAAIPAAVRGWRSPAWLRIAAAAVVLVGLGAIGTQMIGSAIVDRKLVATVESVDGVLQVVATSDELFTMSAGATVRARVPVRTTKGSDAMLRLEDGSLVEIGPRSEVELRGSLRGTVIHLERGQIIVHAATQTRGQLFVSTADCRVGVKGTIFAVDHGLKGSRVSVIEGEVEVRRSGARDLLLPGDQVTTNDRLATVAIADHIGWSRDADQHLALLRELTQLQRDVVRAMEPETRRTATRLLDLVPAQTAVYAAVPNLADGIAEARQILSERLANNQLLREWWQSEVVAAGVDREIENTLDLLQPLGEAVGDEVVIAVPVSAFEGEEGLVIMALLDDPAAFEALLTRHLANADHGSSHPQVVLVEDPISTVDGADLLLWIHDDLFVATTSTERLRNVAQRVSGIAGGFSESRLYARLVEAYDDGVSWLLGVDIGTIMDAAATRDGGHESETLARLGLLDASTLVLERHRVGDSNAISGELRFDGPRRGMTAWLADPAPMGSLEFVSPDASLVAAVVAKDAVDLFDELIAAAVAEDPAALDELARVQAELGLDLRADLAATLGGEGVFAVDGPILPTPGWKVVAEVYDPVTLQATIARMVDALNGHLRAGGHAEIELINETSQGIDFHRLHHPQATFEIVFAMVDGYLIAAPQRALIEHALQLRASGVTLPNSSAFQSLLPENGYTDCSALVYRNFAPLVEALPSASGTTQAPGELVAMLQSSAEPGLLCVYGESDRIFATGTGGDFFGSLPALGMLGALTRVGQPARTEAEAVSSLG